MIVAARLLRDRRRALLWWAVGLVALVILTVSLFPSIRDEASFDDLVEDLPEAVKGVVGYQDSVPLTSAPGYLHGRLFATVVPLVLVIFGIGAGAQAIGGSEQDGTLEPLLANPITRTRVLLERYLATVAQLVGLTVVLAISVAALAAPVGALEDVSAAGLVGACIGAFGLALLHGSLAFAVGAATGRRSTAVAIATAVAVGGYLVQTLVGLSDVLRPLRVVTPWHWYLDHNMLADGPAPLPLVLPLVISPALVAVGWAMFVRRDLR